MNFDLNIDNYKVGELIEMFELPSNFDRNIVEIKEARLRDNIINNNKINKDTKVQTINFLTKAKNVILNEGKKPGMDPTLKKQVESIYHTNYELQPTALEENTEHMIQTREKPSYVSSFPSEFFQGQINPLKKRTIKKNLNIDTRFRDNYYSTSATNFNVNLPINIENVLQMQLNAFELPTTYYVISKQYNNNYFTIIVNGINTIVTIPDGNYNQTTLLDLLNTQLSLAGAPFSYISFMINLTGTQTGTAQTMVGPNGLGDVANIELDFQADRSGLDDKGTPLPLKLGWLLGFRNGIYEGATNYVSEGVADLTGPKYFYLVVDDFNNNVNNNFIGSFNSSILNKNILARISLQASAFNILEQSNLSLVTTPREYFGPVNIQTLNIQLLDEYGRIVNLNNMDYSFCLNLTIVYDL